MKSVGRVGGRVGGGFAWALFVAASLGACGDGAASGAEMQTRHECAVSDACGDCECPAGTSCYSHAEPCREPCPEEGEKVGEYYCISGLKFPCEEALANHTQRCTVCGCWDGLYCNAGECKEQKPEGTACSADSECEASCCPTTASPDQSVCSARLSCRLGIGEDCMSNADCPESAICTDNGFCTAGCDEDADCGVSSHAANICVTGAFNVYIDYFPGRPGVCVPICDRDDPARDCSRWGGACELNPGAQSWCEPDLP